MKIRKGSKFQDSWGIYKVIKIEEVITKRYTLEPVNPDCFISGKVCSRNTLEYDMLRIE